MTSLFFSIVRFLTATPVAFAQHAGREGATYVAGELGAVASGGFGDIAATIASATFPFINGVAILTIVIAGVLAITAQDENRIANARKVLVMSCIGVVLINVAYRIMVAYTVAFNFDEGAAPEVGADIIITELLGFIAFAEAPVAIIAIITIMAYGLKAVVDYGGEQGSQAFKKAVFSVLMGIVMIVIKFIVAGAVVSGNPTGIWDPAVRIIFYIVSYAALIAVVVIVLAGVYLILNLGDENRAQKAKGVIISVTFGLVFMLVIAGLLAILIDGIFGAPAP